MYISLILIFILYFVESKSTEDNLDNIELRNIGVLNEKTDNENDFNSMNKDNNFYKNICKNIKSNEESKNDLCIRMCEQIEDYCSQQEYGFEECMKDRLNKGKGSQMLSQHGCQFPETTCEYSKWSDWSKCSGDCLSREYLPTRYRTRKVINNRGKDCSNSDSLENLQFEICTELPNCESKKSIKTSIAISDGKRFKKIKKKKESEFPEWITEALNRYPDLSKMDSEYDEEEYKDNRYQIMKSVKNIGIISTKCGCSSGYYGMNFLTFIESEKMINQLDKLCRMNIYNQLVFEGNGRYVYYCLNNIMFKESEDREPLCEEPENTEYIACKKEYEGGTELILFILHEGLKVIGTVFKDLIVCIYGSIASMVLLALIVWWFEEKRQEYIEHEPE